MEPEKKEAAIKKQEGRPEERVKEAKPAPVKAPSARERLNYKELVAVDFSVLPFLTDSIIGFYLLVDIDGFHICVGIPLCSYHLSLVISTAFLNALLRSPSSLQVLLGDINSLYISAPCRI